MVLNVVASNTTYFDWKERRNEHQTHSTTNPAGNTKPSHTVRSRADVANVNTSSCYATRLLSSIFFFVPRPFGCLASFSEQRERIYTFVYAIAVLMC